jgi:UDP-N-acetylglucosamine transferase subunit ALG13
MEVLEMEKPILVVSNTSLMHNHQVELASTLEELGSSLHHYCWSAYESFGLFSLP